MDMETILIMIMDHYEATQLVPRKVHFTEVCDFHIACLYLHVA